MAYVKVLGLTLLATLATSEPPVSGYNYRQPSYQNGYNSHRNSYVPPSTGYNPPSNNYLPPTSLGTSGSGHSGSPHSGFGSSGSPHSGFGSSGSGHSGFGSSGSGHSGFGSSGSGHSGFGSSGSGHSGFGSSGSGHSGYGHSDSGDSYDHDHGHESEVPKSYEFGYSVKDAQSGNDYGRRESSDGNVVRGEYRVQLPDGRTQIVTYHADWKTGFHADVRYEGEARYPEPTHTPHNNNQGGYNYNTPSDFSGSLTGFNGNANSGYKPSTAYGPPGYH